MKKPTAETTRATDAVDELIDAWKSVDSALHAESLHLVGRVIVLAQHLQRSVDAALAKYDMTLGQFDILATLRRRGQLTPKRLLESVVLSSGGMTGRLDGLAEVGWIVRKADPNDRRGVLVELTAKGKKRIDAATKARFAEAEASSPKLNRKQADELAEMLRAWLLQLNSRGSP